MNKMVLCEAHIYLPSVHPEHYGAFISCSREEGHPGLHMGLSIGYENGMPDAAQIQFRLTWPLQIADLEGDENAD